MTVGSPKWSRLRREVSRADLPDHRGALDDGDDLHRAPAARADQRIHLVDLADQARPRSPSYQWRLRVPFGGWLRRGSRPEEPVPLPIAPRPIGRPARMRRGSGGGSGKAASPFPLSP